MPAICRKVGGKYRIVEKDGTVVTNKKGTAVDGGGHDSESACKAQARAINATLSMSNIVLTEQPTSDWVLSQDDENGRTFTKELIYAGEFQQANGVQFIVDELTLNHWAETFGKMRGNGVSVPLPLRHTDDPEANRGEVVGMAVQQNAAGIPALYGKIMFRDDEAAKLAKTANVSISSPPEFVDGKGNRYVRPIQHVALTDYPVIPGLQGFESIAASFVTPEDKEQTMPLLDLTKRLNIECDDEAKAEDAIVAAFEGQTATIAERDNSLSEKDTEIDALKKRVPSDPITVTASHRNMLKDNRTMKLDRLVDGAKISPAVRDILVEEFCNENQLNLVLSQENANDSFDRIIEALGKNEVVQLSGELSGPQGGTPLDKKGPTENPLLADAEKRAKASQ